MPSLPFTFEDLRNLNVADQQRAADEADAELGMHNPVNNAQKFLSNRLGQLKDSMSSADGLIDVGLAMNPVTRVVDMGAKFFGQPGIQEGFTEGTTMTGEVRVPRMPF